VDYIAMQPPGKGAAFWESEVTKMVKVYHAPINEATRRSLVIVEGKPGETGATVQTQAPR
jgi:hypothetical protein